jgi:FkbM family methyltransferase
MTLLQKVNTLCRTKGMLSAYSLWLLHRVLGLHGPTLDLSDGAVIGARWLDFSEYWSFRCGEFQAGPTNPLGVNLRLFLQKCAAVAQGGVAVDAGANVGVFCVELAALGYEVHAFEPIPETYARLRENVALNPRVAGRVHTKDRALGDREDQVVRMTAPGNSPATAYIAQEPGNGTGTLLPVRTTTLDAYAEASGLQRIAFLKLDVEGYEPAVLRGAVRLLSRHAIDTVFFEWCPPLLRRAGFDPGELLAELDKAGYAVYRIGAGGQLQRAAALDALLDGCEWDNLVAQPLEALREK